VIDVWAPWCGPCRYLSPVVEQLAGEMAGRVAFGKVNSDEEPGIAMQYGIQGIPTLLLFRGGKLVGRLVGAMPKEALQARLKGSLGL
jgi:thioredoxin 1